MAYPPLDGFIPREPVDDIKPILNHFADLIDDCVNFGSNIFIWDNNGEEKGDVHIPHTMLLRHFFDLLDSISVLVRNSAADPAKLILRSLLETHFSLKYLLKEKFEERANAFFVKNILDDIAFIENTILSIGEGGNHVFVSQPRAYWESVRDSRKTLLDSPKFNSIYKEFVRVKGKSKHFSPWYLLRRAKDYP